ncbi:beta-carotene 15,15'-monooxygenase [Chryseobacterium sp. T16E-39]|nr:beta-carotene 15,15'-monooxygenase [Chryseobacterium sp. T16E-39]
MANFLVIILIILVVIIYNNLNNKIKGLESKISDLQENTPKHITTGETKEEPGILTQEIPSFETQQRTQSSPEINPVIQEEIPTNPQKDWLSPIFTFLKQNILAVIGIFTLVLGIGYFVKYAIDKNWINETARAAIGLSIGSIIIIIGHFLRKNYTVFSSIILGGGIAILYFTTTIAFREYHLFTQNTAFIITCCITLLSIILSYLYKSEILIIFSLFGGFLAPLMISTGQSNYLFLFTYISVLNIGMLIITFLKQWKSVGGIAFFFTHLYLLYWIMEKPEIQSIYFYLINYVIFYAFALLNYSKKNILSSFDTILLVLVNFFSTLSLVYIFNTLGYEPVIIFPVVFALVNGGLLFKEYRNKSFGSAYSVFAGLTISLVTIAVVLQFKTHLITSVWAIEATLLLFIWKKTTISIFKTFFYILFPLVLIAQIITWTQYFDSKQLTAILNPVFLTSVITIVTLFFNLMLLKRLPGSNFTKNSFFENAFKIISYATIYFALLFELIYQVSEKPFAIILCLGLLLSLYYIFILLLLNKKLEMNRYTEIGLIYIFFFLTIIHVSFCASELITSILLKKITITTYAIYLLYVIPIIYIYRKLRPTLHLSKTRVFYWISAFILVVIVSCEMYHFYILGTATISTLYPLQKHFSILYLPIIWAILSSIFIYTGLKNDNPEFNKIGFTLIGITILKLYAYDVWQMDNISRIIAFILLGVILLLSSFMFQRFKNMIKNLVDKKDDSNGNQNLES